MNECNVEAWWEYDEVVRILEAKGSRGRASGDVLSSMSRSQ